MNRIALIWMLVAGWALPAAQGQRTCGMDSVHTHLMGLAGYEEAFRDKVQAVNDAAANRSECDAPLIIPVAVHFQNTGIPLDCAIEMSVSQVESLNADFGAYNADIDTWNDLQPAMWPGIANQESCVQFCLATLDHPAGFGLQEGDYAVTLDATAGDFDAAWAGYLNFFVRDLGGGVLGYSPLGGQGNGDGATCDPSVFGSVSCGGNTVNGPYNMGRTMTHEIGHYFLLDHPWANGGCGSNDFVNDTPVTDAPTFGCPGGEVITCTEPILWPTYMEYCDDACLFMFSTDQVARMETYIEQNLAGVLNTAVTACQEAACIGFDVAVAVTPESCAGQDGAVALVPSGGTAPYAFTLNGLELSGAGAVDMSAGTFTVAVEDAAGCAWSEEVEVVQVEPEVVLVDVQPEECSDGSGRIEVAVAEPLPFQFSLNGGAWSPTGMFEGLHGGAYTVTVQHPAGCVGEVAAVVANESDLQVHVARKDVSCDWVDNGQITVSVHNATEPVSYALNGVAASAGAFTGLAPGVHAVQVLDAAGCAFASEITLGVDFGAVGEDCPCMVYVPTAFTPNNDGHNDAFQVEASCPITNYRLRIFDRWGNVVFESTDPTEVWVGGVDAYWVQSDVFAYHITYNWGEDERIGRPAEPLSGTFVVIR